MASAKTKVDAAVLLLDELQLDESDSSSSRYAAIDGIKKELASAIEVMDCRLDMIEKADSSKIGWAAAVHYEKSNGEVKKSDSDSFGLRRRRLFQMQGKRIPSLCPFVRCPLSRRADLHSNSDQQEVIFSDSSALYFVGLRAFGDWLDTHGVDSS